MNATLHIDAAATIKGLMQSLGWAVSCGPCLVSKTFDTAVGPKDAVVYLSPQDPSGRSRVLFGVYWSEGTNILQSRPVLVPVGAEPVEVKRLATEFVRGVESAIADSYAVRLLRA